MNFLLVWLSNDKLIKIKWNFRQAFQINSKPKNKKWVGYDMKHRLYVDLKNLDYDIKNIKESSKAVRNGIHYSFHNFHLQHLFKNCAFSSAFEPISFFIYFGVHQRSVIVCDSTKMQWQWVIQLSFMCDLLVKDGLCL